MTFDRCGLRHISTLKLRHTQLLVRGGARTPLEPLELLGCGKKHGESIGIPKQNMEIYICWTMFLHMEKLILKLKVSNRRNYAVF